MLRSRLDTFVSWAVPMFVLVLVAMGIGWVEHIDFALARLDARITAVEQQAITRSERVIRVEDKIAELEKEVQKK